MKLKKISQIKTQEEARQEAINFQSWASNKSFSYDDLAVYSIYFEELAKKFNLTNEFKENGII